MSKLSELFKEFLNLIKQEQGRTPVAIDYCMEDPERSLIYYEPVEVRGYPFKQEGVLFRVVTRA